MLQAVYGNFKRLLFGSGLLAMYVPTAISEVITYVPMLGSASYITFITGNISNLKLPCALNALEMADVEQNSDAGDAVATVAVAVSSIVTTVIVALGVLLLLPLQPVLESEPVRIAGSYMLPALYGCLFLSQMTSKAGGTVIQGKIKAAVLPGILVFVIHVFVTPVNRGLAILACIPLCMACAWVLYRIGQIKVVHLEADGKEGIQ